MFPSYNSFFLFLSIPYSFSHFLFSFSFFFLFSLFFNISGVHDVPSPSPAEGPSSCPPLRPDLPIRDANRSYLGTTTVDSDQSAAYFL